MNLNRKHNVNNPYQNINKYPRALCVCSAGLLRSPTIALVLSQEPYNYNVRAAGISQEYALITVDEYLIEWADIIFCADRDHAKYLRNRFENSIDKLVCLNLPDIYEYRHPDLIKLIKERAAEAIHEEID